MAQAPKENILLKLSKIIIGFWRNPSPVKNYSDAQKKGELVRDTYDEWLTEVAKLGVTLDELKDLPPNSIIVTPSNPDGKFQVIPDTSPGNVLTSNYPDIPSFEPAPSGVETDPIYTGSSWFSTTNNSTDWDTAFSWGDHSTEGYLTSETDPIWLADKPNYLTSSTAATTYVPQTRTININGTTYDLSADRSWIIPGGGGGLVDGDYGDIIVGGGSTVMEIDPEYTNNLELDMIAYAVAL